MRKYTPDQTRLIPPEAKCVFSGVIYDVYQWPQKMYDGSVETFEMLKRPDTVKIVAVLTPEEQARLKNVVKITTLNEPKIVITRQIQPGKNWFYDYPGGRMDATDQDELDAAKREMLEEAGMTFQNWKLIKAEQPFSKTDWLVYTFLATGLIDQSEQDLDAGEQIEVMLATLPEINQLSHEEDSEYLALDVEEIDQLLSAEELFHYD